MWKRPVVKNVVGQVDRLVVELYDRTAVDMTVLPHRIAQGKVSGRPESSIAPAHYFQSGMEVSSYVLPADRVETKPSEYGRAESNQISRIHVQWQMTFLEQTPLVADKQC